MTIINPAAAPEDCDFCGDPILTTDNPCPHCARPANFPNVKIARRDHERAALARRYEEASENAGKRGAEDAMARFEEACDAGHVVIARRLGETEHLANSDRGLYVTYERELVCGLRLPEGSEWDRVRLDAGQAFFGNYAKDIRYGALSLNGGGFPHYGDFLWILRDEMIAHRTSFFDANSGMFIKENPGADVPPGRRADWDERSRLCAAKLASQLTADTEDDDFAGLVLCPGTKAGTDDEMIEAHVGGSISARTLCKVVLTSDKLSPKGLEGLREKLERFDVEFKWTP